MSGEPLSRSNFEFEKIIATSNLLEGQRCGLSDMELARQLLAHDIEFLFALIQMAGTQLNLSTCSRDGHLPQEAAESYKQNLY